MAKCWACHTEIVGPSAWLGYAAEGSPNTYDDAYELHPACADQPWPLYDLTPDEAAQILAEKFAREVAR